MVLQVLLDQYRHNEADKTITGSFHILFHLPVVFGQRIVQGYGRQAFPEPDSLTHRYFTEDIPFGLVTWSSLAKQIGLPLPLTDAFIRISGILCDTDFEATGRTARVLGLEENDPVSIKAAFLNGVPR